MRRAIASEAAEIKQEVRGQVSVLARHDLVGFSALPIKVKNEFAKLGAIRLAQSPGIPGAWSQTYQAKRRHPCVRIP